MSRPAKTVAGKILKTTPAISIPYTAETEIGNLFTIMSSLSLVTRVFLLHRPRFGQESTLIMLWIQSLDSMAMTQRHNSPTIEPSVQRVRAKLFLSLHNGERILILPNAWDVPSARVFEDAGFPAIATSSAALSVSLGYPDGEHIGKDELFLAIGKMARILGVPLSADIESGYGSTVDQLNETIRSVVECGAVGINIEDIADFSKKSLLPLEQQVQRIKAVRRFADSTGIPLVINARTDAYRFGTGEERLRLDEAIRRTSVYAEAGADCLYPVGLTDKNSIAEFVKAVRKPVNIMVRKGAPPIPELEKLGVARASLGPGPMYAAMGLLKRIAQELHSKGSYETLLEGAISFDELNALAQPRR